MAELAVAIANGTSLPDSVFSCPSNRSGPGYTNIPWDNITSLAVGAPDTRPADGIPDRGTLSVVAGVKGPHSRMAYCCANVFTLDPGGDSLIALANDSCSQYCRYGGTFDLWLWCLTREGDSVSNAFWISGGREYFETSGSQPRDGPYNPHSIEIRDYKKKNAATAVVSSPYSALWVALAVTCVARWGLAS